MGNYKRWNGAKLMAIREADNKDLAPCVISEAFGVKTSTINKLMVRYGIRKLNSRAGKPKSSVKRDGYDPTLYRKKIGKDRLVMVEILKRHGINVAPPEGRKAIAHNPSEEYAVSKSLQIIRMQEKAAKEELDKIVYTTEDHVENWAKAYGITFSKLKTLDGIMYCISGNYKTPMQFLFLVNQKRVEESGLMPFHVESFTQ